MSRDFQSGPIAALMGASTEPTVHFAVSGRLDELTDRIPPPLGLPCLIAGASRPASSPGGMPRELLDAAKDLPKEAPRQVAFGQLEHEVPRMSDEAPAGFEEPLLQARE